MSAATEAEALTPVFRYGPAAHCWFLLFVRDVRHDDIPCLEIEE